MLDRLSPAAGAALALLHCLLTVPAWAGEGAAAALTGRKVITLVSATDERLTIGHVDFTPDGNGARISVKLDAPEFTDEFLSMRPFRCLSRPKQMWCHLAYPYAIEGRVTVGDLRDLEYNLMFIWRTYDRVGADAWNGLYFKLATNRDGSIDGALHEADYNVLASPPPPGVTRPVGHGDLSPAEPTQHSFARVEIR